MNEEELIIHVQSYPFLYDLENARYSNQLIRENAWEEIGIKMKCKGKIICAIQNVPLHSNIFITSTDNVSIILLGLTLFTI